MTTQYFQPSDNVPLIGRVRFFNTIQRKEFSDGEEVKVRLSWVRESKKKRGTGRTLFIAVLPGRWSLYSSHRDTPMFENTPPGEPFPGIESSDDICENRRWVLGLFEGNFSTPDIQGFQNSTYIECPEERRYINVAEIEAYQEIGMTGLTNDQINSIASRLWSNWRRDDYDARLWSSQNFVIYLALLILGQSPRQDNIASLIDLHWTLWQKQEHNTVVQRHVTTMGGIGVLGVATGGFGALVSWGYGLYGMFEAPRAIRNRENRFQSLMQEFQTLGSLLAFNEEES